MEAPKNLQDLPFDILHRIFKILDFEDQMELIEVHPKLCDAFVEHCRHIKSFVVIKMGVNLSNFVRLCGSTMIHLKFINPSDVQPLLPDVERYCVNLETISFRADNSNCDAIKSFLERSPKLRFVELVMEGGSMSDICLVFPMFEGVPKVKHLRLYNFAGHSVLKNCIRGFVHLEELTVGDNRTDCESVPKWHIYICDLLCKLRSLRCLTVENWVVFLKGQLKYPILEELTFVHCKLKYFKQHFPKLSSFHLEKSMNISDKLSLKFILEHAKTLKKLRVVTDHMFYKGDGCIVKISQVKYGDKPDRNVQQYQQLIGVQAF